MISINPNDNTERENYKLLIGSIIPRPIAFVTSESKDGVINAAPFSYFNGVCAEPPMIMFSVKNHEDRRKDTSRNVIEKKEFVVHIVSEPFLEQVNQTAAGLDPDESEVDVTDLTLVNSEIISVPGVKEAKVRMECQLAHHIEIGANNDMFVGEVVRFHIDDKVYEEGKINYAELQAISRLAGPNYAKIGDIISIERPE